MEKKKRKMVVVLINSVTSAEIPIFHTPPVHLGLVLFPDDTISLFRQQYSLDSFYSKLAA